MTLIGLRVNAGLSREALAHRAGIGRETVRLAEAGFVPTPRIQFALAGCFKRPPAADGRDPGPYQPLDIWPLEEQSRPTTSRGSR